MFVEGGGSGLKLTSSSAVAATEGRDSHARDPSGNAKATYEGGRSAEPPPPVSFRPRIAAGRFQ
jgi:hypothetical protein